MRSVALACGRARQEEQDLRLRSLAEGDRDAFVVVTPSTNWAVASATATMGYLRRCPPRPAGPASGLRSIGEHGEERFEVGLADQAGGGLDVHALSRSVRHSRIEHDDADLTPDGDVAGVPKPPAVTQTCRV